MNQDFIAENFCVEKDLPDSKCNGMCHLVKQTKKQNHQNSFKTETISLISINDFKKLEINDIVGPHISNQSQYCEVDSEFCPDVPFVPPKLY